MTRVSGKLVLYFVVSLFSNGFALPAGEIDESSESTVVAMREEIKELKAHVRVLMSESPVLGARVRRDVGTADNPIGTESFPSEAEGDQTDHNLQGPCTFAVYPGQCPCPPGEPGARGPPGPAGRDGRDGRDGLHASPSSGDTVKGAVYTRWGRSDCREGSVLVYAGVTAGSHYQSGSGSNYLCLPLEPTYDEYTSSVDQWRARLYSSEYEEGTPRFASLHDHTPVCAVCRAPPGRTTKLMVPARYNCPSDEWRLEYRGYLMSSYHGHNRNEYVCFDRRMEASPGSHGNQQGALLYMVEAVCVEGGGLPCGPYVSGRELTCAVCSI